MKLTSIRPVLAVVALIPPAFVTLLGAPAAGSRETPGVPKPQAVQPDATEHPAFRAAKVVVENHVGCKVKATFAGPGFPSKGKKVTVRDGKRKRVKFKRNGEAYTWMATASCCGTGAGVYESPTVTKGAAPLVLSCNGTVDTPFGAESSDFSEGETIPERHTCAGADVSPELFAYNPPAGTQSLALIMDDPDAGGVFTHWLLVDIPPNQSELPEGYQVGDYGVSGRNDFGRTGYDGPCPPSNGPHRYFFKVFALDVASLGLAEGASRQAIEQAMAGSVIDEVQLIGIYES